MNRRILFLLTLALLLLTPVLAQDQKFRFGFQADESLEAPLNVAFTAIPPQGYGIVWDFGDGSSAKGEKAGHTYYRPGNYTITSRVVDSRGKVVGQGTAPLNVKSAGDERAALTLLLTPNAVRLSAAGTVVYQPFQPRFWLDGKELALKNGATDYLPLGPGTHTATLKVQGGKGMMERNITFKMAALTNSVPFDTEVLRLTNLARARGWNCKTLKEGGPARPALTYDPTLTLAATAQSVGMALNGYFNHTSGLDGSHPNQRVAATGLKVSSSAENIAFGQTTPAEVVAGWLRSPGHCKNIMGNFTHLGLSYISRADSVQKTYWTQVFAAQ